MNNISKVFTSFGAYPRRRPYYRERKIRLCEAQGWRYCYCLFEVHPDYGQPQLPDTATVEHVIPKAQGGTDDKKNLVIACLQCNQLRNQSNPYHFLTVVTALLQHATIRKHWHALSREQSRLLYAEVNYGLLLEKVKAGEASDAEVRHLARLRLERRERLAQT